MTYVDRQTMADCAGVHPRTVDRWAKAGRISRFYRVARQANGRPMPGRARVVFILEELGSPVRTVEQARAELAARAVDLCIGHRPALECARVPCVPRGPGHMVVCRLCTRPLVECLDWPCAAVVRAK
jgi:hypothetical protein